MDTFAAMAETQRQAGEADELVASFTRQMGKLSSQSLFFFIGTLFTTTVGFFFKIYVARVLGSEGLGLYALGMSVVAFAGIFASLGLGGSATRFVAVYVGTRQDALLRGFLRNGLIATIAVSSAIGLGVFFGREWIATGLYKAPGLVEYMPVFALLVPLSTLSVFASQVLQGFQEIIRRTIINSFVQYLIFITLAIACFAFGLRLWGYLLADFVATLVGLFLLAVVAWRRIPRAAEREPTLLGLAPEVVNYASYVVAVALLNYVALQTSQVLLGVYMTPRDVGIYSVAGTLSVFVPVLLTSLNSIFSPVIAELYARGEEDLLKRLFQSATKWVLAFTLPLVAVIFLFAPELMGLFGSEFVAGAPVLVVVALGQLVNVGVGSVGMLLFMTGNQRLELFDVLVTAVVALPLNILLIPRLGILGAGIAAGTAIATGNLMRLGQVYRVLHMHPYDRQYLRLALPAFGALLPVLVLRSVTPNSTAANWMMLLAALVAAYLVFAAGAGAIGMSRDDRAVAAAVISRAVGWLRLHRSRDG